VKGVREEGKEVIWEEYEERKVSIGAGGGKDKEQRDGETWSAFCTGVPFDLSASPDDDDHVT